MDHGQTDRGRALQVVQCFKKVHNISQCVKLLPLSFSSAVCGPWSVVVAALPKLIRLNAFSRNDHRFDQSVLIKIHYLYAGFS